MKYLFWPTTNIFNEIVSSLVQVWDLEITCFEAIDFEGWWWWEHSWKRSCFYLTVSKLDNLKNQHLEKSEIIIHLAKKKLRQEWEKATKKAKLKLKQPVKTKKQKKSSKEEINVIRQELAFPGCRGTSSKKFNTLMSVSVRILL